VYGTTLNTSVAHYHAYSAKKPSRPNSAGAASGGKNVRCEKMPGTRWKVRSSDTRCRLQYLDLGLEERERNTTQC
jgi:hypothetical protein